MRKLIASLFLALLLVSVQPQTGAPTCPDGYYDNTGCKSCSTDTTETCGTAFCTMYYPDLSTDATVCTPVPPCAAGEFFNGAAETQAGKICTACDSAVSTETICNSNKCPGYTWTEGACVLLTECPIDTFLDAASGLCSPCSEAGETVCGVKNGCLNYFFTTGGTPACSPCSDPNIDTGYLPVVNTICNCVPGFFWSAGSCVDCSTTTAAEKCSLCKGYFAVGDADPIECKICSSDPNSNGEADYSGSTAGCGCNAGYVWDATNGKCDTCATVGTTAPLCNSASCAGFAFDATNSKCHKCSTILNSNATASAAAVNPTACVCNSGFFWVAAADADTAPLCSDCASAEEAGCGKTGVCETHIWTGTACSNVCTGTGVNSTGQPNPIAGACLCNKGFAWATTTSACVACGTLTSAPACAVSSCKGYFFLENKCTTCGLLGVETATTNVVAAESDIAIDGMCACKVGFLWNKDTFLCEPCTARKVSECGIGNCLNFFVKGTACSACPAGSTRNSATPLNACRCATGSIWSNVAFDCVACAAPKSLDPKSGLCTDCEGITNGAGALTPYDPYKCKCKFNYTFIGGACTCDTTLKLFDTGAGCGTCNIIPGGLTFNAVNSGCNCISAASWSEDLKKCRCTDTASYMTKGGCVKCSTILPVGTATGGNFARPDECTCADGLKWDTTLKKCVCSVATAFFSNFTSTCDSCAKATYYSAGTAAPSGTACTCKTNMAWDPKTPSCICDATSIPGSSRLNCISCKDVAGSTGAKVGTTNACGCKTGWSWNASLKTCTCLTTTCTCPTGSVLNSSKICVPCSTISGSTSTALSNIACKCAFSFVWNRNTFKCECPITSLLNAAKTVCRNCDILSSAVSKGTTANTCNCMTNYVWNAGSFNCVFKTDPDNKIMLLNGTKVSCAGLGGSTGAAFDNFNCKCPFGSVWRDFTSSCVPCSSFTNATGTAFNAVACVCKADSYWDILSFSCKLLVCKYGVTDSRCTYCATAHTLAKTSVWLLVVTQTEKTIFLSGDAQFATISKAASARYESFASYKCLCASGSAWSVGRRRCISLVANATY